jgi:hypothetical protein
MLSVLRVLRPAISEERMPVSRKSRAMAVSRRSSKPLPLIELSSLTGVGSWSTATGSSGVAGGFSPVIGDAWISSSSAAQR